MKKEMIMKITMTLMFTVSLIAAVPLSSCSEEQPNAIRNNDNRIKKENDNSEDVTRHLETTDYVKDIANHPVFKGFGRLLLPWDNSLAYDDISLSNIGQTMPYHSHVDPATTLAPLNRMIDEINAGSLIFYDIYTQQQKQEIKTKELTGLFFLRGKRNAPFAVICAGGGFIYVGSLHEGFPYAQQINDSGYNAFVLKYRTGGAQVACEDLAAAVTWIFAHAEELKVSTECYSVWGSSAGARMAAYLGSYGTAEFGGANLPRPGAVVMAYTGHADYTQNDPPTYVVVGENDGIANPATMRQRVNNLQAIGVDAGFRLYSNLEHGFGVGYNTSAAGWINGALDFWKKQINKKIR